MTDPARFEAFVRRFQDMVFAAAVRLVGNSGEAEDIAQNVFLRAFQRFDEVGESPTADAWLRTVTRNACLNHLTRYRSRWRLFSEMSAAGQATPERDFAATLEGSSTPASLFEQADRRAALETALRALPDAQRVPLVLFHFEEMSYQAIADTLGVSLGKVKTDIHRGREALKRLLVGSHGGSQGGSHGHS